MANDLKTTPPATTVPVALEQALAEVGLIVAAAADQVRPAIVLPLDVALRVLQEVNALEARRYVTETDRRLLQRSVHEARFPGPPPTTGPWAPTSPASPAASPQAASSPRRPTPNPMSPSKVLVRCLAEL